VREFFRRFLRHSKGQWAGKPFELLDWQWGEVIRPLFGWKRADGTRRFRRGYIEVPKKNGKTTLCAGISLDMLIADEEAGAQVYSAAADREQAGHIFEEAAAMVSISPDLSRHIQIVETTKRLVFRRTGSFYKALSAEVRTKEGLNAHAVIVDELHAQRTRQLWDSLIYSGASRRQPLVLAITTAGWDRETICWEQHEYARGVLNGQIDDWSFFAYIAAAPEDANWTDPAVWRLCNPSLGVTIQESEMVEACREAKASPAKENSFKRYRLNIWTQQLSRWFGMEDWDACAAAVAPAAMVGRPAHGGLDLAKTGDVTAFVLAFEEAEEMVDLLAWFWIPQEKADLWERKHAVPYSQWIRNGQIEATPGNVTDYRFVRKQIVEVCKNFQVIDIGYDPWNATHLATQLQDEDGLKMIEFGQTIKNLNEPSQYLESLVIQHKLRHGGHPVLRWMASNVEVKTDPSGNIRPVKPPHKNPLKIDGIIALVMALGRQIVSREAVSAYEDRGILFL
jgi:phage terminase large subunit-like protein